MPEPYLLQADTHRVDLWSSVRLPYDGSGWMREMRDALGVALRGMTAEPGAVLHAVYAAGDDGQASDAENVLFYNVGSRHFRHLMLTGVRFERAYTTPEPPALLEGTELHHHSYAMVDVRAGFSHWVAGEHFAALRDVQLPSITKTGAVWAAVRTMAAPPTRVGVRPAPFMVRMRLSRPPTWPGLNRSAADVIKPLLDGAIAAYHCHDNPAVPNPEQANGAGIGGLMNVDGHLHDPRWAALGPRRLWWPNGGARIQWNPADDYCVAAEVILDPSLTTSGWNISGSLHDAMPVLTTSPNNAAT